MKILIPLLFINACAIHFLCCRAGRFDMLRSGALGYSTRLGSSFDPWRRSRSYAFLRRSSKQPERKYRPENTNYKFRNVRQNILEVTAPFNKEHTIAYFCSLLSAHANDAFAPPQVPEGHPLTFTKQVATMGPATSDYEAIKSVGDAGVDVFRLNFSHGTRLSKLQMAIKIRQMEMEETQDSAAYGKNFLVNHRAILGDIQGPKLRIGRFSPNVDAPGINIGNVQAEFVELKKGDEFTFDTHDVAGTRYRVQLNYPEILRKLSVGDAITLDDGNLLMRVVSVNQTEPSVTTVVENDCVLSSRKGFAVPNVMLPVELLSEKDVKDAVFCLAAKMDFLALSFIQSSEDILYVKNLLSDFFHSTHFQNLQSRISSIGIDEMEGEDEEIEGILDDYYNSVFLPKKEKLKHPGTGNVEVPIALMPKIEKQAALDDIYRIIKVSDGLMIARGDLGVETDITNLAIVQKRLVQVCRLVYRKPCIVATQMLESMRTSPMPTRAEITDVSNAVYDGADAVMLSAESATGKYPQRTVQVQRRILYNVEHDPYFPLTQKVREMVLTNGILDTIKEGAPRTYAGVNKLLKTDLEEKEAWEKQHADIKAHSDAIAKAVHEQNVDALVVCDETDGTLVEWVASHRLAVPIILLTSNSQLSRRMALVWGVKSHMIPENAYPLEYARDVLGRYNLPISRFLFIDTNNPQDTSGIHSF